MNDRHQPTAEHPIHHISINQCIHKDVLPKWWMKHERPTLTNSRTPYASHLLSSIHSQGVLSNWRMKHERMTPTASRNTLHNTSHLINAFTGVFCQNEWWNMNEWHQQLAEHPTHHISFNQCIHKGVCQRMDKNHERSTPTNSRTPYTSHLL